MNTESHMRCDIGSNDGKDGGAYRPGKIEQLLKYMVSPTPI